MGARYRPTYGSVASLVLLLAGLIGISAEFVLLAGGSPDVVWLAASALAFLGGLGIFLWDRRDQLANQPLVRLGPAAIYFQLARAFLILLVVGMVVAVLSPRNAQEPILTTWQRALTGIGFWGCFYRILAYHNAGGPLGAGGFLAAMVSRVRP